MGPEQTPRSEALVGRIVGPYRVRARLRETGGLTTVIAEHLLLDRHVLLKWLVPATPAVLDRVKEQARALSRLKHRHLLPIIDVGETADGVVYLAFELGDEAPLRSVMARRKALPWGEARSLGRQVAAAVRAAQAAALPLAEVSPSAVFLAQGEGGVTSARVDLATPELLGLCDPSLVADQVHGLGRVLYLMVTGRDAKTEGDKPPADPVLSWPELEIPSDADALIMRAVEPEPAKRWPSLEVLERELGGGAAAEAVPEARSSAWGAGTRFTDARFSEPIDTTEYDDEGTYEDRSFGRRVFARPSKRALISGGVALAAATVLLGVIVMSRRPPGSSSADAGEGVAPSTSAPPERGAAAGVAQAPASGDAAPPTVATHPPPSDTTGISAAAAAGASGTTAATAPSPAASPAAADVPPAAAPVAAAPAPVAGRSPVLPAKPSPVAAPPAAPGAPVAPAAGAAVAPPAAPPVAVAPQPEPAVAPPPPVGGACSVSLGSRPWADVWLDGRRVGFTPLTNLAVPCGPHDVVFTSTALGVERRIAITLRPGEQLKRIVDLEAAPMGLPGLPVDGAGGAAGAMVGCRLSLGSRPWSEVWVDGKRIGITPLLAVPVTCGKHDLLFLSRDANVEHRESVVVRNGQLLKRTVILVEGD